MTVTDVRIAFTVLTVVPLCDGRIRPVGRAMLYAPVVGAALGGCAAVAHALAGPPWLGATLAIAVLALLTRGLHLDGLADTVDGLGSYQPAAQALAIMDSGGNGALGLAAVTLCLLAQVSALAVLPAGAVVVAAVTGRTAMAIACRRGVPAAKSDGLGAAVAGSVPRWAAAGWAVLTVAAGSWLGWRGVLAGAVALGIAEILRRHAQRRLVGVTGDILGALNEVATTAYLIVLAA